MAVIDSDNFITHLVWSGLVDKATCGELKEAIELCTIKDIYTKDDLVAMLTEIQLEIDDLWEVTWKSDYRGGFKDGCIEVNNLIQQKINALKGDK